MFTTDPSETCLQLNMFTNTRFGSCKHLFTPAVSMFTLHFVLIFWFVNMCLRLLWRCLHFILCSLLVSFGSVNMCLRLLWRCLHFIWLAFGAVNMCFRLLWGIVNICLQFCKHMFTIFRILLKTMFTTHMFTPLFGPHVYKFSDFPKIYVYNSKCLTPAEIVNMFTPNV